MIIVISVAAFVVGVVVASVIAAAQVGRSEGRMQFQVSELRHAIKALHEVVTNLNTRVQMMEADLPK